MKKINITQIAWNSELYAQGLVLRNTALRREEGVADLIHAPESEAKCIHIAALHKGNVVGTMHLERVDDIRVKAKQVVVSPTYRGYGIGAAMMQQAEAAAKSEGYKVLILNAKEDAYGFYDRLGYRPYGEPYRSNSIIVRPYHKVLCIFNEMDAAEHTLAS